jgi:hypothetical protein
MAFNDRKAVGMRGWKDAIERLKTPWARNDEDATVVALTEALMWLDARAPAFWGDARFIQG